LSPCAFLLALDSLNCDTATATLGGPIDHPGIALRLDTATLYSPELPKVTGFSCGTSWTMEVVGEIPDDASDHTVPLASRPSLDDRVLCSFTQDGVGSITAHMDVENHRIIFRVPGHSGDVYVYPDSDHGEDFYFTRGSAIFLGVTCSYYSGSPHYTCYASVGHASVQHSDTVTSTTALQPNRIYFCGADGTPPEAMLWWGGRTNETTALTSDQVVSSWSGLSLLFVHTAFLSPFDY
jgi:hypothetical protein